jgi:tetratricopeptide (TPR) repeat protein
LIRPLDRHLDGDELDALVLSQAPGVYFARRLSEEAVREAQSHVESCQDCDRKVQMHRSAQSTISLRAMSGQAGKGPNCCEETEWVRVAAGLLEDSEAKERMNHAAQCGHCGPLLKAAARRLSDETTPDEEAALANLASVRPDWQAQMARTLESAAERQRPQESAPSFWKSLFRWPRPAFATAVLAVLVLTTWMGVRLLRPPSAEQLLARAYAERRTMEVRIPGAKFAPMRVERSGATNFDKPQSLLKAEALISEELGRYPNDPGWLDAKARAEMLDGSYNDAIKTLQRALESQPDSPDLLTDLGSAYYLRAKSADRSIDYGNAIEALGKALAKSPENSIALFNRALACEEMFLYTQAEADWEHYLRIDPQSEWAKEAGSHLKALKEKVRRHDESTAEPLLAPGEFVQLGSSNIALMDSRAEDYLDMTIEQWLPKAFSSDMNDRNASLKAVKLLADTLVSRHHDYWLSDLFDNSDSAPFVAGLLSLAEALTANATGDPDSALISAKRAQRSFRQANNRAGRLRAEAEIAYALHRKYRLQACQVQITNTMQAIPHDRYPWIKVQLELEQYACGASSEQLLSSARKTAQLVRYPTLYLRALGFSASNETDTGAVDKGWSWDRQGLAVYWAGNYRPLRAQHFYDDMSISAQNRRQWWLAVALERQAVLAIAASPNRTGEGIERIKLARSTSEVQLWRESAEQYLSALSAFSTLPQDKSIKAFRATAEIGLADVALNRQSLSEAEEHLRYALENIPPDFHEAETWILLYRTTAKLKSQIGDREGAHKGCEAAVLVAEDDLREVSSEADRVRWMRASSDCYRILVRDRLSENDQTSALELWEWYRGAGTRTKRPLLPQRTFANLDRSPFLPPLHEVEEQLPSMEHETAIVYAQLDKQVGAWIYDNRGIHWKPLPAYESLFVDALRFGTQCADPQSDPSALGRQLYQVLFEPLLSYLEVDRTLVIEADDGFSSIPFAALLGPDGKYLVDRFKVVYLPAVGYRHVLREPVPVSPNAVAVVVGAPLLSPQDQESYASLPDAEVEAQYVAAQFPHAVLISGKEATFGRLSNILPSAEVFHFAGHTRLQPGHTGLLLAPESDSNANSTLLSADALESHKPTHLHLAVLSACATDPANDPDLTTADNLAQAFLRAGVPRVVATRWRVDSTATGILMRLFYRELINGNTVPAALQASIEDLRRSPQYHHPYYWAALEAFGRVA